MNIPNDFIAKNYIALNDDLQHMTEVEAKIHYEIYGYLEHRKYKYKNIPNDFIEKDYIYLNDDLQYMTEVEAKNHYEQQGYLEQRKYNCETNNFKIDNSNKLKYYTKKYNNHKLLIIYEKSPINDIDNFIINNELINNIHIYTEKYNLNKLNIYNLIKYHKFGYDVYTNLFLVKFRYCIIPYQYAESLIKVINQINYDLLPGLFYIMSIINNINVIINDNIEKIMFFDKLKYLNDNLILINQDITHANNYPYYKTYLFNLTSPNYIDFNLYKLQYNDLINLNIDDLIKHYLTKGKYENRILYVKKMTHLFRVTPFNFGKNILFKDIFINFPQFHEDELNNKFWGKGWTDWNNIKNINKYFKTDDKNEKIPLIGCYDYTQFNVRKNNSDLCKKYNIYGFCYYYYYFDGIKALHKPLENMLIDGEPDTKFFLLWANEKWSKRWDTNDINKNILIEQNYSKEYWEDNIKNLLTYFKHKNYIVIDNKPLFGLCVINDFDKQNNIEMINYFNDTVKQNGFDGLLIIQYLNKYNEKSNIYAPISDMLMERQPNYIINYINFDNIFNEQFIEKNNINNNIYLFDDYNEKKYVDFHIDINNAIKNNVIKNGEEHWNNISKDEQYLRKCIYRIYNYDDICKSIILTKYNGSKKKLNGFFCGWDNTSRIMEQSNVNNICTKVVNSEPGQNYLYYLKLLEKIRIESTVNEEFIITNAWNEWGEGNVVEPCSKYGEQRLIAIKEAKIQFNNNTNFINDILKTNKKIIIIFTHYGGGGTEKFLDIFKDDKTIIPIIIRPSYVNNGIFIIQSIIKNYCIDLTSFKDIPIYNYDYYNFFYYEEINIAYNLLLSLKIHKLFINSLVGFSNIMYDMIIELSKNVDITTYLHDYNFIFNEPQIAFNLLPKEKTNDILFEYKQQILNISNKIYCPSYYTKYIYNKYITNTNINVMYHCPINKTKYNNTLNIQDKNKYKILIYGEINEIKGKNIIEKLIIECTNINFVIYGITDLNLNVHNCKINGIYNDVNLSNIINNEEPDIILFCSIFAETFCYALIPALESIYPIICPDYGSFVELGYLRKNTYYIDPYKLNNNKINEIIQCFKEGYLNSNKLTFLNIDKNIDYLNLYTLIN